MNENELPAVSLKHAFTLYAQLPERTLTEEELLVVKTASASDEGYRQSLQSWGNLLYCAAKRVETVGDLTSEEERAVRKWAAYLIALKHHRYHAAAPEPAPRRRQAWEKRQAA